MAKALKILFLLLIPLLSLAEEDAGKSGVGPTKIALPDGPGSIEGLGSAFEPQLNSGTASYRVDVKVPSGTAGLQPSVSLAYNSGSGNGPFGLCWSWEPMTIRRRTSKGIPTYGNSDVFTLDGAELVPLSDGSWRRKIETDWARVTRSGDGWEVRERNGTRHRLGTTAASRVARGGASAFDETFAWHVEETRDVHGNVIEWRYETFPDSPGLVYPSRILWGAAESAARHAVVFIWEQREDSFTSCLSGFPVTTGRRCREIRVESEGRLVRRYELSYEQAEGVDPAPESDIAVPLAFSLLRKVVQWDNREGDAASCLPPLRFGYAPFSPGEGGFGRCFNAPPFSLGDPDVALADVNGDSLPDILRTDPLTGSHEVAWNLGRGVFSAMVPFAASPSGVTLGQQGVSLLDVDGDCRVDLVQKTGGDMGHFVWHPNAAASVDPDDERPAWGAERAFAAPLPPFDLDSSDVRSLDLDGDKRMDWMRTTSAGFLYWLNRGDRWEERGIYLFGEPETGGITYADDVQFCGADGIPNAAVELSDMNGDGLLDLVRKTVFGQSLEIDFWPNLGNGAWGTCMEMARGIDLAGIFEENVHVADVNGDGLSDVVAVDYDRLRYWINLGNLSFSPALEVAGTPEYIAGQTILRFADMNGNGTTDFVWQNWDAASGEWALEWFDFAPKTRPNLLVATDNGLGVRTRVSYTTTTELQIAAREAGTPWRTRLPFASTVVSRIERFFGVDYDTEHGEDGTRTDLFYADGWYDAFEREFRGFAFAEKTERGDERYPGAVVRTAFHVGLPDGEDNDADGRFDEFDEIVGYEEEPLKGRPLWEETAVLPSAGTVTRIPGVPAPDGEVFSRTETEWRIRTLHDAAGGFLYRDAAGAEKSALSLPFATRDGRTASQVWASETRTTMPEANGALRRADARAPQRDPRMTRTETSFDPFGNEILRREWGEASSGDERFTMTDYAFDIDAWILGLPCRVRVTDAQGSFASERRTYYDGESFEGLPLGRVGGRGLATRAEDLVNGETVPPAFPAVTDAVGDPRLPAFAAVTTGRTAYDRWGNPVAERDGAWTAEGQGHERRFEWDTTFHSHVVRETVVIGADRELSTTAEWDYGGDAILATVDPAGHETRCLYDSFWRPTGLVKPGDTAERPTVEWARRLADPVRGLVYDYASDGRLILRRAVAGESGLQRTTTRSREVSGADGQLVSHEYSDGAGRKFGTVSEAADAVRWIHAGAVRPSLRGEVARAFLPFENGDEDFRLPSDDAPCVDTWRDAMGREIRTLQPPETDETPDVRAESLVFNLPFETEMWDAEDSQRGAQNAATPTTHLTDGLGRLILLTRRLRENGVVREVTIRYGYDAGGRLVRVEDPMGNVRRHRHDGLGRRIFVHDPNAGIFERTFDGAGNIVETRDARGAIVRYNYDGANRILSEDRPSQEGPHPTVRYGYDAPSAAFPSFGNLEGRLAWVEDDTGAEFRSYTARGLIAESVKRVVYPASGQTLDFCSAWEYDAMDRPVARTYPDGDRVETRYDARGLTASLPGVLDSARYAPDGAPERMENANGTVTEWSFDPRRRVNRIRVTGAGATAGLSLADTSYTYDRLSNLLRADDGRDVAPFVSATPTNTPFVASRAFSYDGLSRLTAFRLLPPGGAAGPQGNVDFAYDDAGNLVKQNASDASVNLGNLRYGGTDGTSGRTGRFAGDAPGPQALVSTDSGESLGYDDAGNLVRRGTATYEWDARGRLAGAQDGAMSASYRRDWTGRRIWKRVETGNISTTLYIDSDFELRDGIPVKCARRGKVPVARFSDRLPGTGAARMWIPLRKGWNLVGIGILPKEGTTVGSLFGAAVEGGVSIFDDATDNWRDASDNEAVTVGAVFMVNATREWVCELDGTAVESETFTLRQGVHPVVFGRRVSAAALCKMANVEAVWTIVGTTDGGAAKWATRVSGVDSSANDLSDIAPFGAAFVRCSNNTGTTGVSLVAPDGIRWYHADSLGSTDCITGRDGSLRAAFAYWPNGETRASVGTAAGEWGFSGKELDGETGMHHFDARAMLSRFGSFASPDPLGMEFPDDWIGDALNLNLYAYAARNPLGFIDSTGLESERNIGDAAEKAFSLAATIVDNGEEIGKTLGASAKNASTMTKQTAKFWSKELPKMAKNTGSKFVAKNADIILEGGKVLSGKQNLGQAAMNVARDRAVDALCIPLAGKAGSAAVATGPIGVAVAGGGTYLLCSTVGTDLVDSGVEYLHEKAQEAKTTVKSFIGEMVESEANKHGLTIRRGTPMPIDDDPEDRFYRQWGF